MCRFVIVFILIVVDLLICNCIYIECICVYVLPVYSESIMSIVFWNKLLEFWYSICDFVIYYLWMKKTNDHAEPTKVER